VLYGTGRRLSGDGEATFARDLILRDIATDMERSQDVAYGYDDRFSQANASATAGYVDEVAPGVMVAASALVGYRWERLEEETAGEALVQSWDDGSGLSFQTPYGQESFIDQERLTARLSLGVEWTLERYLAFRAGVYHEARSEEIEWQRRQSLRPDRPFPDLLQDGVDAGSYLSYTTRWGTLAGLSANVADRLFVDFYTGSFSFTSYSYGTIRYAF
jgi:hypothetical protein